MLVIQDERASRMVATARLVMVPIACVDDVSPIVSVLDKLDGIEEVIVFQAVELLEAYVAGPLYPWLPLFVESVDEGERAVREALARLRRAGYRAHARPIREMTGSAARAIADEARACGADLIIVGSGRRAGLGGLLLGSTARRLPHCTDRPVLIAAPAPAAETVR